MFGKKYKPAFIPAAGRTPGAGKTEPVCIKGLFFGQTSRPRFVLHAIKYRFIVTLKYRIFQVPCNEIQ
jgi:hypothetical protein